MIGVKISFLSFTSNDNMSKLVNYLLIFLSFTVATKIIRPPVLKIFFDLYLLDEESYRALVFSVL